MSARPSTRFCGPSTLAVAVACNFDQFDRPIAGAINFCLDQITLNDLFTKVQMILEKILCRQKLLPKYLDERNFFV